MEFWAVIGLACLDHVFLQQLQEHGENVEETIREYGFRLSRFELGELRRIMRVPGIPAKMHSICTGVWEDVFNPRDPAPCWWSSERSAEYDILGEPYVPPLENGQPVPRAVIHQAGQIDRSADHDHSAEHYHSED